MLRTFGDPVAKGNLPDPNQYGYRVAEAPARSMSLSGDQLKAAIGGGK